MTQEKFHAGPRRSPPRIPGSGAGTGSGWGGGLDPSEQGWPGVGGAGVAGLGPPGRELGPDPPGNLGPEARTGLGGPGAGAQDPAGERSPGNHPAGEDPGGAGAPCRRGAPSGPGLASRGRAHLLPGRALRAHPRARRLHGGGGRGRRTPGAACGPVGGLPRGTPLAGERLAPLQRGPAAAHGVLPRMGPGRPLPDPAGDGGGGGGVQVGHPPGPRRLPHRRRPGRGASASSASATCPPSRQRPVGTRRPGRGSRPSSCPGPTTSAWPRAWKPSGRRP